MRLPFSSTSIFVCTGQRCRLLLLSVLLAFSIGAHAQKNRPERDSSKVRVLALPVLFYTPDTRFGFGGGGILTQKSPGALYPNSLTFSLVLTQRRQVLAWFPFQYYAPQMKWQSYGELGYYRYLFDFFGVGNSIPNEYEEQYSVTFPYFILNGLKKVGDGQFAGLRLTYENYQFTQKDSLGLLIQGDISGSQGGVAAGIGAVWLTDTRDNRFFPRRGALVEYSAYTEGKYSGSDYSYQWYAIDAATYWSFLEKNTLAFHGNATINVGEPPFFLMPYLGGPKRLRGYKLGKYRDKNMALFQTEWRRDLFWRLKSVLFLGAGAVWGTPSEKAVVRPNYGLGLRFELDKKQKLNIRLDYGFGEQGNHGLYLTVNEAF